jgi:putative membrane protein
MHMPMRRWRGECDLRRSKSRLHRSRTKGLTVPSAPAKAHRNDMKRMQDQAGAAFDRSYMTQMVKDHESSLKLVRDIAEKARDPDLKVAGQKTIPQIENHLEMAKRIASNTAVPEKAKGPKK